MRAFSLRHFRRDSSPSSAQQEFLTQLLQGVVFENIPGKRGSLGPQAASRQALVPRCRHAAVPGSADALGRGPPKERPGEAWAPGAGEPPAAPVTRPLSPPQRLHHRAGLGVHRGHRLQRRAARQHHALQGRPAPARPARSPGAEGSWGSARHAVGGRVTAGFPGGVCLLRRPLPALPAGSGSGRLPSRRPGRSTRAGGSSPSFHMAWFSRCFHGGFCIEVARPRTMFVGPGAQELTGGQT